MKRNWMKTALPKGAFGRSAAIVLASIMVAACAGGHDGPRHADRVAAAAPAEHHHSRLAALADAFAAEGDHSAAIPLYRRAHQTTGSAWPLIGLGRSLSALGQHLAAEDAFRRAVSAEPHNPDARTGLARSLIALGRPAEAVPHLDAALSDAPSHIPALAARAVAADLLGDGRTALTFHEQARALAPEDPELAANHGLSLALQGDFRSALPILERASVRDDATAGVRHNLALALVLAGETARAERVLRLDHDVDGASARLAELRALAALPDHARLQALTGGARAPAQDLSAPANRAYGDDDADTAAAAARFIARNTGEITAAPPPDRDTAAPAAQADADLTDIPLLDPKVGYALQLAAYRKASQLKDGWAQLREKYAHIIRDLPPRRTEVDFGDRAEAPRGFFYRLNAGPLTSLDEALRLCESLRAAGAECWVRPPERDEGTTPAG